MSGEVRVALEDLSSSRRMQLFPSCASPYTRGLGNMAEHPEDPWAAIVADQTFKTKFCQGHARGNWRQGPACPLRSHVVRAESLPRFVEDIVLQRFHVWTVLSPLRQVHICSWRGRAPIDLTCRHVSSRPCGA